MTFAGPEQASGASSSDQSNGGEACLTVRPLTIAVPSVPKFQRSYDEAVPPAPREDITVLERRRAPWSEIVQLIANRAPHGFLIYFKLDVHPVMQLAGDNAECVTYLRGNHRIAEQMFRHDARAMLYAPLPTVIWEHSSGAAWFSVDQPSAQFRSFSIQEISKVGVDLDRKLAALLDPLHVGVPRALLES